MVEQWVEGRPIDDLNLKGFNHPILAAEILSWREEVDNVVDAAAAAVRMKKSSLSRHCERRDPSSRDLSIGQSR